MEDFSASRTHVPFLVVGGGGGSVNKGLLPAPMTTAERLAITELVDGLLVYDTDIHATYQYVNGAWVVFSTSAISTNDIGTAGAAGFGVGICPTADLPAGMVGLYGYATVGHDNYGNYVYLDGSIMCWVPAFYYKYGTGSNGLAVNVVSIRPKSYYGFTVDANADGYALHRAFIDGGVEKSGFFVDKYKNSKNAWGTGFVCSSIKNGLPLSTVAAHNPMYSATPGVGLTACGSNAIFEAIKASHARDGADGAEKVGGSSFFVASLFIRSALALLSLAHGQASSATTNCAWYHATYNYPKGCNNNALADTDDTGASTTYVTDGYSNCGKAGSCGTFAKSTHNGQNCGVADLNGLMLEISLGMTCIAPAAAAIGGMSQAAACVITWTGHGLTTNDFVMILAITQADWVGAKDKIWQVTELDPDTFSIAFDSSGFGTAYDAGTDPGTVTKGTFYVAKQATAMKNFTSGNSGATDHWGATGVAAMMDAFAPPFESAGVLGQRMGSGANQVLSEAVSGAGWLLTGMGCPKDAGGIDTTGTNLFGKDYFYQYIRNELCLLACGAWDNTSSAGVWCLNWSNSRPSSYNTFGWRCACYPV